MSKFIVYVSLACLFLTLAACREDALISRTEIQFLQQGILVTTWGSEDHFIRQTEQLDTLYINQGNTAVLTASYTLNGISIPSDSALSLYGSHYWEIEGKTVNATSFEHEFDSTGYHICVLNTIDYSGDTLKDTLHVFVGTPLSISLSSPSIDASIEPLSDDYIELDWNISGIDPWEKASCTVYAAVGEGISRSANTRWYDFLDSVNALSTNDCKSGMRLKGPLISTQWLQYYGLDLKDTSLTVYWGVKATAYTDYGFEERVTDASFFNTLYLEKNVSVLQIKPIYESITPDTQIETKIVLVNARGDTIRTVKYDTVDKFMNISVYPQTGLHIYANETKQTDYEAKPIVIDVPERTMVHLADSMVFKDKVPPRAAPVKTSLALTDSIQFYFMDNGSGISPTQKKFVIADFDTVNVSYEPPILSFANPCRRECQIKIPIPDNARNHNSELFWKLVPGKDSIKITGPFVQEIAAW